jgi:hypothetical protein
MLYSIVVLLFRYWRCSDQIGQWIPFTVVIVTSLHTCTYKGDICNRYNRSKFIEFKNSKTDFRCLEIIFCLLAGHFPDFMTLRLNIFLFVYLVSCTDTVNGLRFDLRYHRDSLISLGGIYMLCR